MSVRKKLLADLVAQVRRLEVDVHEQISEQPDLHESLKSEHAKASEVGRTGESWSEWLKARVNEAAAAWVLGTVFVRFCEDNGLLSTTYLTSPLADQRVMAEETQEEFFRSDPSETDRGWLLAAFAEIRRSQAGRLLFDTRHNPLYRLPISHDGARQLIAFWRRRTEDGMPVHNFASEKWDTRFLGDLYQDLSETARKRFGLVQTPRIVEEFILDYTLTPAIDEFGHDVVRMIDPACGSGHFLLGAFERLLMEWSPAAEPPHAWGLVRAALNAVHGVDINPFAVAIARFRLFTAALKQVGMKSLRETEQYEWPINVAVGDALIKNRRLALPGFEAGDPTAEFAYSTEDIEDFPGILSEGAYHVVVGNPPFLTVKDRRLNELYRMVYEKTCSGKYPTSVPFIQRSFELACEATADGRAAGYVGQILPNSFMKREFGRKLIESFFRDEIELTHVVDASGAYIPGHGTPTVILVGRNKGHLVPRRRTVRTVMGIRGEPSVPAEPENGYVWCAIVHQSRRPGSESEWVSVADVEREWFSQFPWSLAGGGSGEVLDRLEVAASKTLKGLGVQIGFVAITAEDDAFFFPCVTAVRRIGSEGLIPMGTGDRVRDHRIAPGVVSIWPYDRDLMVRNIDDIPMIHRALWRSRRVLQRRKRFGVPIDGLTFLTWWEYGELYREKLRTRLSIVFAFVATHNHFVLDRGGKVFKQSAPVIKLPEGATEDQHLELLGVLNSSTACFWLKQVCHDKGNGGIGGGIASEDWERFFEFTGTKLLEFPLPRVLPLERGRQLDALAQELTATSPSSVAEKAVPTKAMLAQAREKWHSIRGRMIAVQEEIDWEVYGLYGLLDDDLTAPVEAVPELMLGGRAFEIVLARRMARGEVATEWFARHGSTPITELPAHWPDEYRAVVKRRIGLIESNRNIGLIERPECKRRWATEGFDALQKKALEDWLLDRFEDRELWFDASGDQPRLLTTSQLADRLRTKEDVLAVADLYTPGMDLEKLVNNLIIDEHVPYLAALRYKPPGLIKRAEWESVWDQQRREDAAETEPEKKRIRDAIPVPSKYTSADFQKTSYWRNRGKLDVPKERFISYPYASRDGAASTKDGALLLGWAGFDHAQQARALAMLIVDREQREAWDATRLTPLLAGLREVLPWVRQWHPDFDPTLDGVPGEIYSGFLSQRAARLHLTEHDLTNWRPPNGKRTRRKKGEE